MKIVLDIEANALKNPTKIHLVYCKDVDTNVNYIFRNITEDVEEKEKFLVFAKAVTLWIGHNWLGYDYPVLRDLVGLVLLDIGSRSIDTLVLSKLLNYSQDGHSIEYYGNVFGLPKIDFSDFSKYSQEMEDYCKRDVEICHSIYTRLGSECSSPCDIPGLLLEQKFQLIVNDLESNGFAFNFAKAGKLLKGVEDDLQELDLEIERAFPPRLRPVKEINPRLTQHGTLNRSDFRWLGSADLSEFNGGPFTRCSWTQFNPSSHRQLVQVLTEAGWVPTDKTTTHLDTERELNRLKYRPEGKEEEVKLLKAKLEQLRKFGWKVNENNLATLPAAAPAPARTLARRILLESRRRTLTEWTDYEQATGQSRIHGKFYGIGAWTHRMAHQSPNTANIPSEFREDGSVKILGKELRSLWIAPRNRLLVGVDAEGIQLRIFAHLIDDGQFTEALVKGRKEDGTDPHSLNRRILGSVCRSRQAAKKFIYALLLGAGLHKLSEILSCTTSRCEEALDRLLRRYTGFARLKEEVIPKDAVRGWFLGLDGRKINIPGDTVGQRKHLAMSGYLQAGEAIVIKETANRMQEILRANYKRTFLVNIVHDEFVIECRNSVDDAEKIIQDFDLTIAAVGRDLGLRCPLKGDGHYGLNWWEIH